MQRTGHTSLVRPRATVSAALAPVAVIGSWTWAAAVQPKSYSPMHDTISALAARNATDPWIMTTGLAVLGTCHMITASGLIESRPLGRAALALGGLATIAVAALRQPSAGHVPAATIAFVLLAVWPALSAKPSVVVGRVATSVLLGLLAWLAVALRESSFVGLSERIVAGSQALWPLAVAVTLLRGRKRAARQIPAGSH